MKISCKLKSHQASSPQSTSLQNAQHPHYTPIQSDQFLIITTRHRLKPIQLSPKQLPIHSPLPPQQESSELPRPKSTNPNPTPRRPLSQKMPHQSRADGARAHHRKRRETSEICVPRTCLVVSGRRMPPALFLGCSSFSTSTRFSDGIRRFAIAAVFFLGSKLKRGDGSSCFSGCRGPQGLGFFWITATARV